VVPHRGAPTMKKLGRFTSIVHSLLSLSLVITGKNAGAEEREPVFELRIHARQRLRERKIMATGRPKGPSRRSL
jgi:hypothetical protein